MKSRNHGHRIGKRLASSLGILTLAFGCTQWLASGHSVASATPLPDAWKNITGNATLTDPDFLWTDSNGNMYVTDIHGNHLDELPSGSSVWQPVPTPGMTLNGPFGVTTDSAGDLFMTNSLNTTSEAVEELNKGATSWMDLTNGYTFNCPEGIAVDKAGDIFVANFNNGEVVELPNKSSTWTPFYQAQANSNPSDLYFDSAENLYLVEPGAGKVIEFPNGHYATPQEISTGGTFSQPYQITEDSFGNLYVTNFGAPAGSPTAIEELQASTGSWIDASHSGTGTDLNGPVGITFDQSGHMIVANYNGKSVEAYEPLTMSSSATIVTTGGQITLQGATTGLANQPVTLTSSHGSFGNSGSSITVTTDASGNFSINWTAPTTPGIYTISGTSFGTTINIPIDVTKYINNPITVTPVMTTGGPQTSSFPNLPNPNQSTSSVQLTVPAGAIPAGTPLWVTSAADASQITPSGTQVVAAVGLNFSATPAQAMTLTITNPNIETGDVVYEVSQNGAYNLLTTGVTISGNTATISVDSDPDFLVAKPTSGGGGGPVPPTIIQDSFTEPATVGQNYSATIHEIGGTNPMQWTLTSGALPTGLTLNNQGEISGTPTTAGTYKFTVKVTDANKLSSSKSLALTVNPAPSTSGGSNMSGSTGQTAPSQAPTPPVSIRTQTVIAPGQPNQPYQQPLMATDGTAPYSWSIIKGTLPEGLGLDSNTGIVSGVTPQRQPAVLTIQVTDANGKTQQKQVVVDALPMGQKEMVWQTQTSLNAANVPSMTAMDSGTNTTFIPIWYVMQMLKSYGVNSAWDGHTWGMTTSNQVQAPKSVGNGNFAIKVNGMVVEEANAQAAIDPNSKKMTTYMPVWYVQQVMNTLGITGTWNGTTWSMTN